MSLRPWRRPGRQTSHRRGTGDIRRGRPCRSPRRTTSPLAMSAAHRADRSGARTHLRSELRHAAPRQAVGRDVFENEAEQDIVGTGVVPRVAGRCALRSDEGEHLVSCPGVQRIGRQARPEDRIDRGEIVEALSCTTSVVLGVVIEGAVDPVGGALGVTAPSVAPPSEVDSHASTAATKATRPSECSSGSSSQSTRRHSGSLP